LLIDNLAQRRDLGPQVEYVVLIAHASASTIAFACRSAVARSR
jgi:hypothetical protein